MTNRYPTPTATALVTIGVAKMRNEVLIEIPGRAHRRRLTVLNIRAEHDRFLAELEALGMTVVIGLEATGNYHRPLAWRLLTAGFDVRQVSSVALARTREALHNGWDKNDPKGAQVILHMLRIGATQRATTTRWPRASSISRSSPRPTKRSRRPRPKSCTAS